MGNACTSLTPEQKAQIDANKLIDSMLHNAKKEMEEEIKLLLLGPGESGKSTIFKQMKILQLDGGFTKPEKKLFRHIVFGNCITQMKVLVAACAALNHEYQIEQNKEFANKIEMLLPGGDAWTPEVPRYIESLWQDPAIQLTYEQRDKAYQLNDSASYFFENIDRFAQEDYSPTNQDILRARVRSTGIEEATFVFEDLEFRLFDVGGQRSERRKWIHCFDCVTAVLFVTSLSEYDQTLREDDTQNRMRESLLLFDEISNSPWFKETAFILFLNKTDLFKEKIKTISLNCCFKSYKGENNYDEASAYIKKRFLDQNHSAHKVYPHFTMAISTENVKIVFNCVKDTLLQEVMNNLFG